MTEVPRKLVVDVRSFTPIWDVTGEALDELRAATPAGWHVYVVSDTTASDGDGGKHPGAEVMGEIPDAEVYFGFGMSRDLFLAARQLRWIHSAAAGVASALFPELVEGDVLFTNSAGIHGPPIAEHVIGGVLHFMRGFDIAVAHQAEGRWDKSPMMRADSPMREFSGARVLIVGTGGLGEEIAWRMFALGARCVGVRRRPELGVPRGFERVVGQHQLDEELPGADVVVLCAPATPETNGLLSAARLALLHSGAIVVNVARGSLLDEGALAAALAQKRIRGAFLDVASREPLPSDSPLWGSERLLVTPHISAVAPVGFWRREMSLFLENWGRYRSGIPLRNIVNKRAGY